MKIGYLTPVGFGRSLGKYKNYEPFDLLRQEIDSLFDNRDLLEFQGPRMQLDVVENDQGITISAELPGINEKDVSVSVNDNILIIEGEKKTERDEQKGKYHLTERSYGSFKRSIPLSFDADPEKTHAHFKNGVLTIEIQKPEQVKEKSHLIPIKTS